MSNARVTFNYPEARVDGEAIVASELAGARIEVQADGAPEWTEVALVEFPNDETLVQDIGSGTWHFRGTVIGTADGDVSKPVTATIVVPKAEMGTLETFEVTLE